MAEIPGQYQTAGYRTIFGDAEARQAIAIAEIGVEIPGSITPAPNSSFPVAPGNNFIGRSGIKAFRATANFTRPSDTTAYAVWDAISNSTSAPSIMSADLASFGASANQFICFTNARVVSSVAQATLPQVNVFIANQTFTATNDNAQFSVSDAIAQGETVIIPCLSAYNLAANSRCVSDPGQWLFQLGATTNIFFALQSANAYTPASGERFDVILEGFLL